ncbi:MAG TPA: DUF2961 domain-containing protein, partial [Polyangiaceae bacterium]|nr:DUF2961 domain-containing protein [Polyangiaceae bacterium]
MRKYSVFIAVGIATLWLVACGSDSTQDGPPSTDTKVVRTGVTLESLDLPNAAPLDVGTTGPIGLGAMTAFSDLPYLRTAQHAHHESSFDRTGANDDWSKANNFLYTDANGDKVLMDAVGPGCVYRMWFTGQDPSQLIHVYFDGESTPRIDMTFGDFFSGTKAPFLAPLVANDQASSGGFFSYLPLAFARSIRITATGAKPDFYFNFDYHRLDPSQPVTTFTGNEDSSAARALWSRSGSDPKSTVPGTLGVSNTVGLDPGQAQTLLDVAGPRQITRIEASIAGVFPVHPVSFDDSGRAHKGTSQFTVAVDATNEGAVLQRRLDYGVADQVADVYVDGALAGTWSDRGSDATNHWRDHFFPIPKALTNGKSQITVRIQFKSSSNDYNEFFYWIYSRVNGAEKQTDTVDVGTASSESAHAYSIQGQTWQGEQKFTYPQGSQFAGPLNNLWVRITWNSDSQPSVFAPLGSFFAQGQLGPGFAAGLAAGMNPDGTMYMFFPMPFATHAKVEFVNRGTTRIDDVWFDVEHAPFAGAFDNVGTFHVAFNTVQPATSDVDLVYIDTEGTGQVVGVVESESGPSTDPSWIPSLEGDERARIDDRRTPSIHGTGTEDFYNGGWYFNRGLFTLPTHGLVQHVSDASTDGRAMYRFFVSDAIPFQKHMRLSHEHGPADETSANAWNLAYYYYQPTPRLQSSDTLSVGDAVSESNHAYSITSQSWQGARTFTFEGENQTVQSTATGRAHKGESQFTLAVNPNNRGVVLRRLLDQGVGQQLAHVSVNGTHVTDWYTPGTN